MQNPDCLTCVGILEDDSVVPAADTSFLSLPLLLGFLLLRPDFDVFFRVDGALLPVDSGGHGRANGGISGRVGN